MNKIQLTGNDKKDLQTIVAAINGVIDAITNKGSDNTQYSGNAGNIKIQDHGNGKVRISVKTKNGKFETGDLNFIEREG
jgi:hypothetical protein